MVYSLVIVLSRRSDNVHLIKPFLTVSPLIVIDTGKSWCVHHFDFLFILSKQDDSFHTFRGFRTSNPPFTSQVEQKHGRLVLDSWLVSLYLDDIWKWIYHLSCWQQKTSSHENQRVYCFTRSGRFIRRDERCSFTFLLRDDNWLQLWRLVSLGSHVKMAVRACFYDELVQFGTGSLHCSCETLKILDFYETPPRGANDFLILDNCCCYNLRTRTKFSFWQWNNLWSHRRLDSCNISTVSAMLYFNLLLCIHAVCCLQTR